MTGKIVHDAPIDSVKLSNINRAQTCFVGSSNPNYNKTVTYLIVLMC